MTETVTTTIEDNIITDLTSMLAKAGISAEQQNEFLTLATPYLVERDHKIFTHAYNAGRASA